MQDSLTSRDPSTSAPPSCAPPPRRSRLRWASLAAAIALVLCALAFGLDLRADGNEVPALTTSSDVPVVRDGHVVYSQAFADRAEIVVADVEVREVLPFIDVAGTVTFDPRRVAAIGTRILGRVTDISVVEGDLVKRSDVLAQLESAELGGAQADVMSLRARAHAAEKDVERKRLLVDEGIASRRSAQQVEAHHASLRAELEAARQRVHALGGTTAKRKLGVFSLRSPIDGEIVGVHIRNGQSVEPSHTAFYVADLSEVWVELAVFEGDRPRVSLGDAVDLEPRGDGGPPVKGLVSHIGRVLDEDTRTAAVRVVVDNTQRRLAVGQAIRARVYASRFAVEGPSVPRDAVVLVDGRPTVFVESGINTVQAREVEIAGEGREWIAIGSGLEPGDRVVVAGAFALKSELFR